MPRMHPIKPPVADRSGRHYSEVSREEAEAIWAKVKVNPANGGKGLTWTEAEAAFGLKDTNGMSSYNAVLRFNLNGKAKAKPAKTEEAPTPTEAAPVEAAA